MKRNTMQWLTLSAIVLMVWGAASAWPAQPSAEAKVPVEKSRKNLTPRPVGWSAPDQLEAKELSKKTYPYVDKVLMEDLPFRQQRLRNQGIGLKDIKHSYILLDSPYVDTYENKYGSVRFMHAKHAASLDGDCAVCHHYRPADPAAEENMACRSCHQDAFAKGGDERIGLKAAYHLQCMDCHEKMKKGPVSCEGCHDKKTVDHKDLVKLPADPTPQEVTAECLRCHSDAGEDMLTSAH
ncbi:MAG: cytochrome c family protein, partial [Proteobacteria bacterium]|nr:cytochrome c family protein [Pseudomonadota bacterium]